MFVKPGNAGRSGAILLPMQRMRRVGSIITYVLMIPLTIMSTTVACPMAGNGPARATAGTTVGAATRVAHDGVAPDTRTGLAPSAASHHPAPHHPPQHHPGSHCIVPCAATGCAVNAQCASVAAHPGAPLLGLAGANLGRALTDTDALRSVSTAPEPPPPRA